jgi:hypothetical protein
VLNNEAREYARTTTHPLETIEKALDLLKGAPLPPLEALDIWVKIAARENLDLITLIQVYNMRRRLTG